MHTTILGLGNILLRDEGFGVHFLRRMEERFSFPETVQLVDGGTLGFGLLDTVTSCKRLFVIDIIKSDDPPGTIYRFTQKEMELRLPEPTSAHEVEFFDVLAMADLMGEAPETTFLCIAPKEYGGELQTGLTPVLEKAFPAMERLLLAELKTCGLAPRRRCASDPAAGNA